MQLAELEVMNLVIAGKPNEAIVATFGISAEIHRGRMMEKRQVGSVAELVAWTLLWRTYGAEGVDTK